MVTDASLTGSESVRDLQRVLHVKAKEDPKRRFHALCDKVWRKDFLFAAWQQVRRNGGSAGVDGETFRDIGSARHKSMAGGTGAGSKGGYVQTACGTSGTDPEEAARQVPAVRHSLYS